MNFATIWFASNHQSNQLMHGWFEVRKSYGYFKSIVKENNHRCQKQNVEAIDEFKQLLNIKHGLLEDKINKHYSENQVCYSLKLKNKPSRRRVICHQKRGTPSSTGVASPKAGVSSTVIVIPPRFSALLEAD